MRPQGRNTETAARDGEFAEALRRYRAAAPGAHTPGATAPVPLAAIVPVLGALPPGTVAALALNLAMRLAHFHANGAVHGALTPWTVMLSDDGPLLGRGDAGPPGGSPDGSLDGMPRASDGMPRTLAYLTPEQVLGVPTSAATDVFALGGVLVYAATGRPPFGAGGPAAVLFRIVSEPAELGAVPASLRGLLKACLTKEAERRPSLRTVGDRALGVLKDVLAVQPPSIPVLGAAATSDPMTSATPVTLAEPVRSAERAQPAGPVKPVHSALGSLALPSARIPRRRGRSRNSNAAMLGTAAVVVIGVVAAFFIHGAANSSAPMLITPPSQNAGGRAPLPGGLLAGPGCPASPWTAVAQRGAAASGPPANLGGGPADCGGRTVGFVKDGITAPGSSGYAWTFRIGAPARCGLSVYIADAKTSSGFAHYRLSIPAPSSVSGAAAGTMFQINQSASKGQWVAPLELSNLMLHDGSVQLTLTDAGSYAGDRFHVTASAVRAVCTPAG